MPPKSLADVHAKELAEGYDEKYRKSNYFRYRRWLYWPFIRALLSRVGARPGDKLLDAGCGQGYFSWLFAEHGIDVLGVDISTAGVKTANRTYQSGRLRFQVGDVLALPFKDSFDYVFARSCSLYNSLKFETEHAVTDHLLSYVRPGGTLIFDYYSRLGTNDKAESWIYHSVQNVRNHFSHYPGAAVYFSVRIDALFFGKLALTKSMTKVSSHLGRAMGLGGELIALVRKPF